MNEILTAIDAELEERERERTEAADRLAATESRITDLGKLRDDAKALADGEAPTVPAPAKTARKPRIARSSEPTAPTPAPKTPLLRNGTPKVTDEERRQRGANAEERDRQVIAFVRKHGEIRPAQAAEIFGVTPSRATTILSSMCSHRQTGLRRYELVPGSPRKGVAYRLEIAPANDSGAKTKVEQRVVDAVQAAQPSPIDETTLTLDAQLSITDLRTVAAGLVRRGVLTRKSEEGTVLFDLGAGGG